MATLKYFQYSAKAGKTSPIFIRLSAGRGSDFIVKSGLMIDPANWSNKTQTLKQRIYSKEDQEIKTSLSNLRDHILKEVSKSPSMVNKQWLEDIVFRHHNNKAVDAETMGEYINRFIKESEEGERKNKDGQLYSKGTLTNFKAFRDRFKDYQDHLLDNRKRATIIDFEDITIDFYNGFVSFLTDKGYRPNTIGKHIKTLKMFMEKSLHDKKHSNRDFQLKSFRGISRESFAIYLSEAKLKRIEDEDLNNEPGLELARDAFLVLCETALRISDYDKVDVSIVTEDDGYKFIHLNQTKTGGKVVIPVSARLEKILNKYEGQLPRIKDQYLNRDIKKVAERCGLTEKVSFQEEQFGKKYTTSARECDLITCHTGRRTACTNWYKMKIPTIAIMMISGHTTEKNFLKYIKVSKEENARLLAEQGYFGHLRVAN